MRVVSLLPSATEIVCALGLREQLVARSHECDYPVDVEALPILTKARVGPLPSSKGIDAAVRDVLRDALAVYEIDVEGLRDVRPDVIVTQDLCDVCAVSIDDVRAAVARLARSDVRIVNLHPTRLADIWADIQAVADATERAAAGREVVRELERRVEAIAARAARVEARPRVLTVEWIEPIMIGGMWMPELVSLAGGTRMVTAPGEHAPTLSRDELAALDPDVVIVKPCGFGLERTLAELPVLGATLPWETWRCVAEGRVFVADGNAFFNRPGPRIVESLEIMAACAHPEHFQDFAARHAASVVRVTREMRVEPLRG